MSRELAGLKLTPEERRAVQAAAVKMVADNAIADNRRRRAPLWQDRRAVATLAVQAIVAIVATLALLHSINPAWW